MPGCSLASTYQTVSTVPGLLIPAHPLSTASTCPQLPPGDCASCGGRLALAQADSAGELMPRQMGCWCTDTSWVDPSESYSTCAAEARVSASPRATGLNRQTPFTSFLPPHSTSHSSLVFPRITSQMTGVTGQEMSLTEKRKSKENSGLGLKVRSSVLESDGFRNLSLSVIINF